MSSMSRCALHRTWKRALAVVALLMTLSPGPALAQPFFVGDGDVAALRQAIANAASDPDRDTIILDGSTFTVQDMDAVSSAFYIHRHDVTIIGNGSIIERDPDAEEQFRLFLISDGGGSGLTLQDLTVRGGFPPLAGLSHGAGIFTQGRLTLNNVNLTGNTTPLLGLGGGLFVNSAPGVPVVIIDSTISDNIANQSGGGIHVVDSELSITNSTISGNSAVTGSALFLEKFSDQFDTTVTVTDSTITGNVGNQAIMNISHTLAIDRSTVAYSGTFGAGVENRTNGHVTLRNTTLSGNVIGLINGQSAFPGDNVAVLIHSTITGNGRGVVNGDGTLEMRGTLVSGNVPTADAREVLNDTANGATIISNGINLFGHAGLTNAQAFSGFTPGPSDVTATSDGTNPTALEDILSTALADNGGPTLTHALIRDSIAIDGVTSACPPPDIDQRGFPRPADKGGVPPESCDIGAFEYQGASDDVTRLSLQKVLTGADPDPVVVGSVLTFTVTATNNGNVTLSDVLVNDPRLDPAEAFCATLSPGADCVLIGTYTVTQDDVDAGEFANTATVMGEGPDGNEVSDEVELITPINQDPALSLQKVLTGAAPDPVVAGSVLTFTITATNTGNVTLSDVLVEDAMITPASTSCATLAVGASCVLQGSYTVTPADADVGQIVNIGTATAMPPLDEPPLKESDEYLTPVTTAPVPVPLLGAHGLALLALALLMMIGMSARTRSPVR